MPKKKSKKISRTIKKRGSFPTTLYVLRPEPEPDDPDSSGGLLCEDDMTAIRDGELVAIYSLVSVRKKTMTHDLVKV